MTSYIIADLNRRTAIPVATAEGRSRKKAVTPVVRDEVELKWLSQLADFYAKPGAKAVWVGLDGLTPRARIAIDEMQRAGDYGLDPAKFNVPWIAPGQTDLRSLASAEIRMSLAVARYAWHARGGRFDPTSLSLWLDYQPRSGNAADVVAGVVAADDPASALRALHPQHEQFEFLRRAYLKERGGTSTTDNRVSIPMGGRIKPGSRHPDVAMARYRLGLPAKDGDDELLDTEFQQALYEFMNVTAGINYGRGRGIDDDVRQALNGQTAGQTAGHSTGQSTGQTNGRAKGGNKALMEILLVNMERWRWLPRDFGDLYVWNNLPEFETRVIKNGQVIHQERIIIGEPATQTPVFSDSMVRVIFQPEWNVPETIKLSSLWSSLKGGDYGVLKRRGMRIVNEGKEINPAKLKYASLNARDVPVVMDPGPGNPLGAFKFVFPNKHDVYMHDTTSKDLFESKVRTFSHGCIRVRNPQALAEVVLGEAKGWNKADVRWQARGKKQTKIELDRAIPIHNTYFTVIADASGTLRKLPDIYGHDKRLADALRGVDPKKIGADDPALALKKKNEELANAATVAPPRPQGSSRSRPRVAATRRPAPSPSPFASFFRPAPPQRFYAARSGLFRAPPQPRGFFFFR